jgi:hypothetical protein
LKEEERKMKVYKFNKRDTRFAPWTALCVLSLIAAMVFAVPSLVFAQTYEFSQDCETALVGTQHTIRVKVTGSTDTSFGFWFGADGPNPGTLVAPFPGLVPDANGEFEYTYTSTGVGTDELRLIGVSYITLATVYTTWTDNEADLCLESKSAGVTVGGRLTLNAKKKGALKIAVCAADGLEVSKVDPETVQLAGVAPWHWKQKDSSLCPDGKDGVVDLVLKFKNREVVEALENSVGELADGQEVELALTGMNHGKAFDGVWQAMIIKKKGKRHWKKKHHQKKDKKDKGSKK